MGDQPHRRAHDGSAACEGAAAFELLGWRWTAFLIWALMDGPRRFSDLLDVADGLSDRMLTKRLRELEEAGIVTRHRYREVPPRVEYSLTEAGRGLRPVIDAMEHWARRWTTARDSGTAATMRPGSPRTRPAPSD